MDFLSISILIISLAINPLSIYGENSHINWNGNNWAMSCDFEGNDLTNVKISSEKCGGKCADTNGCTHFTWTSFEGGTCWMKQGVISKDMAVSTSDPTMVCGVMGGSTQSAGTTTRYWDCCKPSCGWPGNVPGGKSYVKSCRKDGDSVNTNPDASNVCPKGDGEAFACNSHSPWVINDQLAYGFAAAQRLQGLNKNDLCCTCYELKFTESPVEGKTMIVQVINSGDDLNENQFDLQIPGGGVGKFNGCKPQWGAPDSGWGQPSGGVSSAEECKSLPAPLQSGCLFRFDWFKGANNPKMTYSKVTCPDDLIAKSGCSPNN